MRPTPPSATVSSFFAAGFLVSVVVAMVSFFLGLLRRADGVSAAHDLGNLLSDFCLAGVVRQAGVVADQGVRVVARRLHGLLSRGLLAGGGLEEGVEDPALDVD